MNKIALAAACLMLATPALAENGNKTVGQQAKSVGEQTGVNALIGASPTTQDFVSAATISDMFEKQSSMLAEERGDEKIKAFARKMVTDHQVSSEELKKLVASGQVKVDVPTALDSTHQGKIDTLKGLKGDDFTKQYHSDQVSAHETAVDLFKRYAEGGENAEIKAWAAKTRPHLEEHLTMAQDLRK